MRSQRARLIAFRRTGSPSSAPELVLRHLLPLAHQGLAAWGIDSSVSDRLLGVIEKRCTAQGNGA